MSWIAEFPGNFVWSNAALIVHAEDDRVVPVESARKVYDAIGSPRKHLKIFTAEDGSMYHAQADNRQIGVDYIADWIAANLP